MNSSDDAAAAKEIEKLNKIISALLQQIDILREDNAALVQFILSKASGSQASEKDNASSDALQPSSEKGNSLPEAGYSPSEKGKGITEVGYSLAEKDKG